MLPNIPHTSCFKYFRRRQRVLHTIITRSKEGINYNFGDFQGTLNKNVERNGNIKSGCLPAFQEEE